MDKQVSQEEKDKFPLKSLLIWEGSFFALVILVVILLTTPHFESVKKDAVRIAGQVQSNNEYSFTIDTYPYEDTEMSPAVITLLAPEARDKALKAIQYVNRELGFDSNLYNTMIETNGAMYLQSEENDDYKVTWEYHLDEGLEVTYYEK